jgi:hypothetical protein
MPWEVLAVLQKPGLTSACYLIAMPHPYSWCVVLDVDAGASQTGGPAVSQLMTDGRMN